MSFSYYTNTRQDRAHQKVHIEDISNRDISAMICFSEEKIIVDIFSHTFDILHMSFFDISMLARS